MLRRLLLPHGPIQRTKTSHLQNLIFDEGLSSATFRTSATSHSRPNTFSSPPSSSSVSSACYQVINRLPPAPSLPSNSNDPNSSLCPPLHYHRYQTETFHVIKGQAKFFFDALDDGRAHLAGPGDIVMIPKGRWHTFRNASSENGLELEFSLAPEEGAEQFLRNTWAYRDDCRRAGVQRSQLQVWLFGYEGGVVGAVAPRFLGNGWVARLVGVGLNLWGGFVIGRFGCGLRGCYGEYFDDERGGRLREEEKQGEDVAEDLKERELRRR